MRRGCSAAGASLAERPPICYKAGMIKNTFAMLFVLTWALNGVTAPKPTKSNETLRKLSDNYRSAKLVDMAVEKTVKLELQGRETKYQGHIYLANGKFRWENSSPEETLLVFDGTTIWSVQYPPKEFGGAPQVARGLVDKKTKSQILISSLLGDDLQKNFKVVRELKDGVSAKLEVAPEGSELQIQKLELVIDTSKNQLNELSYRDDLGNLITMKFSKINFLKKSDNSKFKYQPPKGAQVTNL